MTAKSKSKVAASQTHPAGIEYHGIAGSSHECQLAVARLVQFQRTPIKARILSCTNNHGLLLSDDVGDQVAIKTGFSSGYGGTAPTCFSQALQLLIAHRCEIDECDVNQEVLDRLDQSALTSADVESINSAPRTRPGRWQDYMLDDRAPWSEGALLWREFQPVMPFALIDDRLFDFALSFWEDPDDKLMKGYRKLEDLIRGRTGLKEHGQKLFSAAFQGDHPKLTWDCDEKAERIGRANLFTGTYMAYRNPRAHQELERDSVEQLAEFLLLNHLFRLEKDCQSVREDDESKP